MAESLINTAILEITQAVQMLARTTPQSTLANPKLARLRRRRNRLVAMLMFSISGVAASCMPEFARIGHVERDPWASGSEDDDEAMGLGEEVEEIDGLGVPPPMPITLPAIVPAAAAAVEGAGNGPGNAGSGSGSGSAAGNGDGGGEMGAATGEAQPQLSSPPPNHIPPALPLGPDDEADDWINDALTGGGYISQALSTALLRSSHNAGALSANGLEVRLGDGGVVKLKSHMREVRRLVAVFDHAWRTVLEDLDVVRAQRFLEERQKMLDHEREKIVAWVKKDKEEREKGDKMERERERQRVMDTGKEDELEGKKEERGKEKDDAFSNYAADPFFCGLGMVDGNSSQPGPRNEGRLRRWNYSDGVANSPLHVEHPSNNEEGDDKSLQLLDFDPFRTDRPDVVANEAVRKINRIGKRIVRRVQLDRRVLVARTKKRNGGKEEMRTASRWRALVH